MRALILFTIMLAALLISCSDSTGPADNAFSLKVTLRDAAGNPLEGYRIAFHQDDLEGLWGTGRPATVFTFTIFSTAVAELKIYDFGGSQIRLLDEGEHAAGNYNIVWDGKNDLGQRVPDGVYRAVLNCYVNSVLVKTEECYPFLLAWLDASTSPYLTDANGQFNSTDITPFPALYCDKTVQHYDENGTSLGTIELNTTTRIVFQAPDETCRKAVFQIKLGKNTLNFVWEELETTQAAAASAVPEQANATPTAPAPGKGKLPLYNYPNPFN